MLTANSNPHYGARMTLNFHLLLLMMMMTDHDVDSDVYIIIYLITNALSLDKALKLPNTVICFLSINLCTTCYAQITQN